MRNLRIRCQSLLCRVAGMWRRSSAASGDVGHLNGLVGSPPSGSAGPRGEPLDPNGLPDPADGGPGEYGLPLDVPPEPNGLPPGADEGPVYGLPPPGPNGLPPAVGDPLAA